MDRTDGGSSKSSSFHVAVPSHKTWHVAGDDCRGRAWANLPERSCIRSDVTLQRVMFLFLPHNPVLLEPAYGQEPERAPRACANAFHAERVRGGRWWSGCLHLEP